MSIDNKKPESPADLSKRLPTLLPRKTSKLNEAPSQPRPEAAPLLDPPSVDSLTFSRPERKILSKADLDLFTSSPAYNLIISFVFTLSDSVADLPISTVKSQTQASITAKLNHILDDIEGIITKYPAIESEGSRFGNKAFYDFYDEISNNLDSWHESLAIPTQARVEVSTYLQLSFGNRTRIDYGSGHELNFIIWLLCLHQLSLIPLDVFPQIVLVVFPRYLKLMRYVQTTYYLEPAGSHGVWGLDDYQFLPFLFGASQLLHHKHIRPMSIHSQMVLEECSKDYLYLDQVSFVNSVKNVEGLRWHSPMLDDISSAKNWNKVEAGMRRMFLVEVLGKLPVMQHFLFGGIVQSVEGMGGDHGQDDDGNGDGDGEVTMDGMKHVHAPTGWGDCCGIKVPSSVGAMQEMKKSGGGRELRRVPFD